MHQTTSGILPLFHAMASERMRAFSDSEVTSAEMYVKRWVEGFFAWDRACSRDASRFLTVRATRMRFAPRAESSRATSLPMPWEEPVKRTVCSHCQIVGQAKGLAFCYLAIDVELISFPERETHYVEADDSDKSQEEESSCEQQLRHEDNAAAVLHVRRLG